MQNKTTMRQKYVVPNLLHKRNSFGSSVVYIFFSTVIHNTYLVVKINQQNSRYDAKDEKTCPIIVIYGIIRVFPQVSYMNLRNKINMTFVNNKTHTIGKMRFFCVKLTNYLVYQFL